MNAPFRVPTSTRTPLIRLLLSVEGHDRPYLDAPETGGGDPRGDLDGVVQVPGLDQVEPAQLLLGLGEGAVGGGQLAVSDPDGGGARDRLERLAPEIVTAPADRVGEGEVLAHQRVPLVGGHGAPPLFLVVDQADVLHGSLRDGMERLGTPGSRSGGPQIDNGAGPTAVSVRPGGTMRAGKPLSSRAYRGRRPGPEPGRGAALDRGTEFDDH